MLYETDNLWLESAGRIATLWLNGAGVGEVGRAVERVRAHPFVEILVLRGAHPAAFDVRAFDGDDPFEGRRVLKQLESLPIPTLAYLEGPCFNRGLELALACDYRLAAATPDAWIGFDDAPRWGGLARIRGLVGRQIDKPLTAREARDVGLVDHAFCERRAKIELRTWLDRLEDSPRKRRQSWFARRRTPYWDRIEWEQFLRSEPTEPMVRRSISESVVESIELRRCPQAVPFAVEFALRGGTVIADDRKAILERLTLPRLRGRVTPLELERIWNRVKAEGRAKLVLESESGAPYAIARATLVPHSQPVRIGFSPFEDSASVELTSGTATTAIAKLFASVGYEPRIVPDTPALAVRPVLAAYWDEAVRLVAEGFPIDLIDGAGRSISRRPPLRALDEMGMDVAASLVPRLRPFADAGLREAFYHSDRPGEANALAGGMLGAGPRLMEAEDGEIEADADSMRSEIERRLKARLDDVDPAVARAAGILIAESGDKLEVADRSRRKAA